VLYSINESSCFPRLELLDKVIWENHIITLMELY